MLWLNYLRITSVSSSYHVALHMGFLVLSDEAIFTYKVDNVYSPQTEASLRWNDETVAVKWPIDAKDVILSDKDLNKGLSLKDAKVFE